MAEKLGTSQIIRFGLFEADLRTGELWKNGRKVRLQGQPFRILCLLLERHGTVVARDEIRNSIWPDETFGEFDQSLNTAIKKIRSVLGDSAENPRFVETIPRRGYRFISDVRVPGDDPAYRATQTRPRNFNRWVGAATLLGIAAVGLLVWFRPSPPMPPADSFSVVPLTSYTGRESAPTFSPDGSRIAFSWSGDEEENQDIYVRFVEPGSGAPLRITEDPAIDFSPAWSPDGHLVAFLRSRSDSRAAVMLASALGGGQERELFETDAFEMLPGVPSRPEADAKASGAVAWSPNGEWLAFPARAEPSGPSRLAMMSLESREIRWMTDPPDGSVGDTSPSFSPDGSALAFVRYFGWSEGIQIHVLPLTKGLEPAGDPRPISAGRKSAQYPRWTADSATLVYYSAPDLGQMGLWTVRLSSEYPPQLWLAVENVTSLAMSSSQDDALVRLAYESSQFDTDIWRVDLAGPVPGEPLKLISSTRRDSAMQISPDGARIAFTSGRSGLMDIWISDIDGEGARPLTHNMKAISPRWSPDGSQLVFHSRIDGQADVYVMDSEGGAPRRITTDPADDAVASWSRDGRRIYFGSVRSGAWEIWAIGVDGGDQVQITQNGGFTPFESYDRSALYHYRKNNRELWKIPLEDGDPAGPGVCVGTDVMDFPSISIAREGVYYVSQSGWVYRVDSEDRRTQVVKIQVDEGTLGDDFAVSPDGQTILFSRQKAASDLVLLEGRY